MRRRCGSEPLIVETQTEYFSQIKLGVSGQAGTGMSSLDDKFSRVWIRGSLRCSIGDIDNHMGRTRVTGKSIDIGNKRRAFLWTRTRHLVFGEPAIDDVTGFRFRPILRHQNKALLLSFFHPLPIFGS